MPWARPTQRYSDRRASPPATYRADSVSRLSKPEDAGPKRIRGLSGITPILWPGPLGVSPASLVGGSSAMRSPTCFDRHRGAEASHRHCVGWPRATVSPFLRLPSVHSRTRITPKEQMLLAQCKSRQNCIPNRRLRSAGLGGSRYHSFIEWIVFCGDAQCRTAGAHLPLPRELSKTSIGPFLLLLFELLLPEVLKHREEIFVNL